MMEVSKRERFPLQRASSRCRPGQRTFPIARGNDEDAPIAVIDCRRASDCSRPKPDMTGSAYSITSSARARINGGIVRPSALAVLRLMNEFECGRLLNRKISRL